MKILTTYREPGVGYWRPSWDAYFLGLAGAAALRATCPRKRVGCVLVDAQHRFLSSGYNGPASGAPNCVESPCAGAPCRGGQLVDCEAVHAEINALVACPDHRRVDTCYSVVEPCVKCVDALLATSCRRVVYAFPYKEGDRARARWERSRGHSVEMPTAGWTYCLAPTWRQLSDVLEPDPDPWVTWEPPTT